MPDRLCQPATKEEVAEWARSHVAVRTRPETTAISVKAALNDELAQYRDLIAQIKKVIPEPYVVTVLADILARRREAETAARAMGAMGSMLGDLVDAERKGQ